MCAKWISGAVLLLLIAFTLKANGQSASITSFGQTVNGTPGTIYHQAGDLLRVNPTVAIGNENNNNTVILKFTATWTRDPNQPMSSTTWEVVLNPNTPTYDYNCASAQTVLGSTANWYSYDLKVVCNDVELDWSGCGFNKYQGGGGGGGGGID